MLRRGRSVSWLLALLLAACQQNTVAQQEAALTLSSRSLATRQIQARRFDTKDERLILSATAGVLQDLGFTTEETAVDSGLIVASKDRSAIESGQVTQQVFLAALAASLGVPTDPTWDQTQKIRVSIVTKPAADMAAVVARVTFQRVIWDNHNKLTHLETIEDAEIYRQFFDKLAQAAFLEAHEI